MGLFTGDGRIGRLNYFLVNLAIGTGWIICFLVLLPRDAETQAVTFHPALIVILPIVWWASVGNMIRRLHDRGHSGWLWLLSLVPIVGLLLGLYLLFAPGDELANRFGPPPGGLDERAVEAQRVELEQLRAQVDDVQRQANESYLREDGSYDSDWLASSVPGLGPAPGTDQDDR